MKDLDFDKVIKFLKGLIPYIILIVFVLLFKRFVMSPIRVNGDSMYPTLTDGDIMILDNIGYKFKKINRNDIVVINIKNEYIIKRVIGLPGETITYKDHALYVNDEIVEDSFAVTTDDFSVVVPDGEYYVLGDNRINSMDSRFFGSFSDEEIRGKADFVVFPFTRFGVKK